MGRWMRIIEECAGLNAGRIKWDLFSWTCSLLCPTRVVFREYCGQARNFCPWHLFSATGLQFSLWSHQLLVTVLECALPWAGRAVEQTGELSQSKQQKWPYHPAAAWPLSRDNRSWAGGKSIRRKERMVPHSLTHDCFQPVWKEWLLQWRTGAVVAIHSHRGMRGACILCVI